MKMHRPTRQRRSPCCCTRCMVSSWCILVRFWWCGECKQGHKQVGQRQCRCSLTAAVTAHDTPAPLRRRPSLCNAPVPSPTPGELPFPHLLDVNDVVLVFSSFAFRLLSIITMHNWPRVVLQYTRCAKQCHVATARSPLPHHDHSSVSHILEGHGAMRTSWVTTATRATCRPPGQPRMFCGHTSPHTHTGTVPGHKPTIQPTPHGRLSLCTKRHGGVS